MLTYQEMSDLIAEARRNEKILIRMEQVESYLFSGQGLMEMLNGLCPQVAQAYSLQEVTLGLEQGNKSLNEAMASIDCEQLPKECFWISRGELNLMLGELANPMLSADISPTMRQTLLKGNRSIRSMAVLPLRARDEDNLLGVLCLGSASTSRYRPNYDTDFLQRLARKTALGLETAVLFARTRLVQRREAAVEMAGAACHELAQPLTNLCLLFEKAKRLGCLQPAGDKVMAQLDQELDRINRLLRQISQVTDYVTKPYAQGLQIIDLEAAHGAKAGHPKPDKE